VSCGSLEGSRVSCAEDCQGFSGGIPFEFISMIKNRGGFIPRSTGGPSLSHLSLYKGVEAFDLKGNVFLIQERGSSSYLTSDDE